MAPTPVPVPQSSSSANSKDGKSHSAGGIGTGLTPSQTIALILGLFLGPLVLYAMYSGTKKAEWYAGLSKLADEGWPLVFTDGTGGKNGEVAAPAVQPTGNPRGPTPRSGIQIALKDALHARSQANLKTAIGWVRSHIGLPGNEKADTKAAYKSHRGRYQNSDTPCPPIDGCALIAARLHFVRKVDSPACPYCDHGYHITFVCPLHSQQRQFLIGEASTW
ncbi:hypothetical protein EV426DRAFT_717347 [Tirmania nivea]|nr:hypothetical protein EV426DRAFT_717347 [Tirmania nivea]